MNVRLRNRNSWWLLVASAASLLLSRVQVLLKLWIFTNCLHSWRIIKIKHAQIYNAMLEIFLIKTSRVSLLLRRVSIPCVHVIIGEVRVPQPPNAALSRDSVCPRRRPVSRTRWCRGSWGGRVWRCGAGSKEAWYHGPEYGEGGQEEHHKRHKAPVLEKTMMKLKFIVNKTCSLCTKILLQNNLLYGNV